MEKFEKAVRISGVFLKTKIALSRAGSVRGFWSVVAQPCEACHMSIVEISSGRGHAVNGFRGVSVFISPSISVEFSLHQGQKTLWFKDVFCEPLRDSHRIGARWTGFRRTALCRALCGIRRSLSSREVSGT